MMQRRRYKALAMVLALGIVAAGCGSDDDDEATSGNETEEGSDSGDSGGGEVEGPPAVTLEDECEAAKADGVEAPEGFKVNLVTDIGRVDDGTFNQFAFEAMESAAECFGFTTSYIETVSEADYNTNISTSLEDDPNVVITNGFLIATDTMTAAEANPDVDFIGVDQFQEAFPANYIGVQFREDQGGYMAGVLAASLSESGVVGVVGGREDVPPVVRFVNAYEQGALSVNPDIQVLSVYNESFTTPDKGASDAAQFIGEGADVIFGAGGQTGSGAIAAATEEGVWGIGVDQDEYFTTFNSGDAPGSEYLATSAVKRVDLAVFRNIVASMTDEFEGGLYTLEAANDGITYAPFHDAELPEEAVQALEDARSGLADGSIDTGVDPVTGLPAD
jgi:basic membrane lipoprotein Med (substrate-binding protein (PBP1-ABC) superfamily)